MGIKFQLCKVRSRDLLCNTVPIDNNYCIIDLKIYEKSGSDVKCFYHNRRK